MTEKNLRDLDAIAAELHKVERKRIFEVGELLLEAQAQCEHGEWMDWLEQFDWNWNTANRYASVAELGTRFPKLKNLNLPVTVFYDLLEHDDSLLPSIIGELAKFSSGKGRKRLSRGEAKRIISIGIGRHEFGAMPDATLVRLVDLKGNDAYDEVAATLKQKQPEKDEEAERIVNAAIEEYRNRRAEADASAAADEQDQAEALLDGDPPDLPKPSLPPLSQKLERDSEWPEEASFVNAVGTLLSLCAKSPEKFVGHWSEAELLKVADLLRAVAGLERREAA